MISLVLNYALHLHLDNFFVQIGDIEKKFPYFVCEPTEQIF